MINFRDGIFNAHLLCDEFGLIKKGELSGEGKIIYELPGKSNLQITFGTFEQVVELVLKIQGVVDLTVVREGIEYLEVDTRAAKPVLRCHVREKESKSVIEVTNSDVPKIKVFTLLG